SAGEGISQMEGGRAMRWFAILLVVTATFTQAAVPEPKIPKEKFSIDKYGAVGDGTTRCTAAIKSTIEACGKAGGGVVVVPAGRWLTGPIVLLSNMKLRIEKGATLLISNNPSDFQKRASGGFEDCIFADGAHDIAITGEGTIDGQGEFWWKNF